MSDNAVREFKLPSEADDLVAELWGTKTVPTASDRAARTTAPPTQLARVVASVIEAGANRAYIEEDYIDFDFRDEFANFYAGVHRNISDRCRRVHFFASNEFVGEGTDYLGFSVIRPLRAAPVGRTVIVPPDTYGRSVSCSSPTPASTRGDTLTARGFPFMQQDGQYAVCAHVSIWMIALYHHQVNATNRVRLSDIAAVASSLSSPWRTLPSDGMTRDQLIGTLTSLGLAPIVYSTPDLQRLPANQTPVKVISRYLNSGMPVILASDDHVVVVIGYGREKSGQRFFVVADEEEGPYERLYPGAGTKKTISDFDHIVIPMPGKIYLTGESAEQHAREAYERLLNGSARRPEDSVVAGSRLRLRTYATRGSLYKRSLVQRGIPNALAQQIYATSLSNWVWVVEWQDSATAHFSRKCVLGEMVLDATSGVHSPEPFFAHLRGRLFVWDHETGVENEVTPEIHDEFAYTLLGSGTACHDIPLAPTRQDFLVPQSRDSKFARLSRFPARLKRSARRNDQGPKLPRPTQL